MTYKETTDYLYSMLPAYHRIGKAAYKGDLDNTIELDSYFGHPHTKYRTLHVAGTNGKGSVSHMLASILQEAGYRTGLYTSPHLRDFRERIRLDGQMISEEEVISFVEKHDQAVRRIEPSFFELTVAMAFDFFARMEADIVVVEVGMGGRLDSTNIITPELSVITNIGHDHMEFLGDTLAAVAGEKAGIIKEGVPVVIGETQPETADVFSAQAALKNAPVSLADREFLCSLGKMNDKNGIREYMLQDNYFGNNSAWRHCTAEEYSDCSCCC
jgi:dihydrofolate synthase/folylpolyglutamate synthase